jgi:hypothetical protein
MKAGMSGEKAGFCLFARLASHCGTLILPNFMREIVKEDVNFFHKI